MAKYRIIKSNKEKFLIIQKQINLIIFKFHIYKGLALDVGEGIKKINELIAMGGKEEIEILYETEY